METFWKRQVATRRDTYAVTATAEVRPFLTLRDVQARLALSEKIVRRMITRGDLEPVRPTGWALRFRPEDIERLCEGERGR